MGQRNRCCAKCSPGAGHTEQTGLLVQTPSQALWGRLLRDQHISLEVHGPGQFLRHHENLKAGRALGCIMQGPY